MMGRGSQETNVEALGVAVDRTGLVMMSSGHLGSSFSQNIAGRRISQKSTPSNFKVIFGNEADEYDAVLAAKDSKLNLAFVQIKDLKGKEIKFQEFSETQEPLVGQQIVSVLRYGRGFDFAPHFRLGRIAGEIKMPRKMWAVTGASGIGLPVYDLSGKVLGVLATQSGSSGAGGGRGMRGLMGLLGGGMGGGNAGVFVIPCKKIASTVEQAQKSAKEALEKAKEAEAGEDEGEEGEDEGEEEGDEEEENLKAGDKSPSKPCSEKKK
jgi:hypothetical protein